MRLSYLFTLCVAAFLFLPAFTSQQQSKTEKVYSYNLDGVFSGAGGKYYFRQLGNEILWYGEEDAVSPTWSNVGHGVIKKNIITAKWADVPKGSIMQSGHLKIKIISNDELQLIEQTGDFFATDSWTRIVTEQ